MLHHDKIISNNLFLFQDTLVTLLAHHAVRTRPLMTQGTRCLVSGLATVRSTALGLSHLNAGNL